jgi:hypothetical protein
MRPVRCLLTLVAVSVLVSATASAQPAQRQLNPLEVQVACGPPTSLDVPAAPLRVAGSQDPVNRFVFGTGELLVLDGGSAKGVQLGQQFVIRHARKATGNHDRVVAVQTTGWLSIVAVNEKTAIGKVEHFCDAITTGDYVEPFIAPVIPENTDRDIATGELDFSTLGRILTGPEDMNSGAVGGLMLVDPGKIETLQPGARFAVYRDPHTAGLPLASVGEGVVLSVGKSMVLTKITRSRDAIVTGDYVVPRK